MFNHEIVSIVFRIINFFIAIAAGYYIFKKYGLNKIQAKIKARQELLRDLHNQHTKFENDHNNLMHQQKYQNILSEQLKFKISLWSTAFEKVTQERNVQKADIKELLQKKIDIQKSYIERQAIEHQVLPEALKQARVILEKKFESSGKNTYIDSVLNHIKKSIKA